MNIPAVQLTQTQLLTQIRSALVYSGLLPQFLEVEIIESVLMRNGEATASTLKSLKDMEVCIAMDDFGTRSFTLFYLKHSPVDTLKIDKSFSRDNCASRDGSAIVSAIAALGGNPGLSLVAEGVETVEQGDFLESQLSERMQGY